MGLSGQCTACTHRTKHGATLLHHIGVQLVQK
jgi:hypothetical protein